MKYAGNHSENGHNCALHASINYGMNGAQLESASTREVTVSYIVPLVPNLHHMDKDLPPVSCLARE